MKLTKERHQSNHKINRKNLGEIYKPNFLYISITTTMMGMTMMFSPIPEATSHYK